ncbi:MAG: hypothetical protein ACE5FT_05455 [Candidatus Nanoarchaeia archaeon]
MMKKLVFLLVLMVLGGCGWDVITGSYLSPEGKVSCIEDCMTQGDGKPTCELKCYGMHVPAEDS